MSGLDAVGLVAAVLYGLATTFLATQGLHSLWLLWRFRRGDRERTSRAITARDDAGAPPEPMVPNERSVPDEPVVLVQLPVFNERDVVARLVAAAGALLWPHDRLRIQLLDDSTDDTCERGRAAIQELAAHGIDATHVRRADRLGFKAGALAHGLAIDAEHAGGPAPFVAIFDADFEPAADFLARALTPFADDERLAFVQGRWEHSNADCSALTRAQALGIDGHFAIEQAARAWTGLPLNFNGTCGVWRRSAIEASGGWQHDTLTEDLDLSYRAQLHGYTAAFDIDLAVPGELPPTLSAWRAQQFRWAKGSLQTARKLLPSIWRSDWNATRKLAATLHLTHYLVHPAMVANMVLAPVAALCLRHVPMLTMWLGIGLLLAGALPPVALYVAAQRRLRRPLGRLRALPALLSFGSGIAVANTRAAWQALAGTVTPFVRTPKQGAGRGSYRAEPSSGLGELAVGALGLVGLLGVWSSRTPWLAPILAVYVLGFLLQGGQLFVDRLRTSLATSTNGTRNRLPLPLAAITGVVAMAWLAALARTTTWQSDPLSFAGAGLLLGGACFAATRIVANRPPTRRDLVWILGTGLLLHALATALPLSDDVRRYATEGAQLLHGENPYATSPAASAVPMADVLGGPVNHAAMTSIYPPPMLAMHMLAMRCWPSLEAFRVMAALGTTMLVLLTMALLVHTGRSPALVVAVLWNPVLVLFTTGEAHHDVLAAAALLAALLALQHRRARTAIVLGSLAALLKPFALAALPVLLAATSWRHLWIPAVSALLAYLPFAAAGHGLIASLVTFGGEMQFHGALEPLLRDLLTDLLTGGLGLTDGLGLTGGLGLPVGPWTVRLVLLTLLLTGLSWLHRRSHGELDASRAARGIALLLLCLPTLHPWYFTLLVALLPFTHSRALLAWTTAAAAYWLHGLACGPGELWGQWPWAAAIAHLPFVVWMLVEAFGPLRVPEPRLASAEPEGRHA